MTATPKTGTAAVAPGCPQTGIIVSTVRCAVETTPLDLDVCEVVRTIRTGGRTVRGQITQIRNRFEAEFDITGDLQAAKLAVAELKKNLPAVTRSGRFSYRASEYLVQHSGLLCADLDSLGPELETVREKLKPSPHLFALFLSPSGNGLKAVFRVPADASKHPGSFREVEAHVKQLTGLQLDESGKDVARLCFLSHDPEIYVNENATELEPLPEPEKPNREFNSEVNLSERQRIAVELLGDIDWQVETSGFVQCPGKHLHTTANGERDCKIDFDHVPTVHCFHDHCRGILGGINHELRSRIAKAEHLKPGEAPRWQDPQPLPEDLPAVPPFDYRCLPETLVPWIKDIAERMQCPPDFPAVGAMIALGSVLGRKIGIRPKRRDDWVEIANLWGCIIARPGLLKTPKGKVEKHLDAARDKPVCRRYEVNDSTIPKLGELLAENPNGLLLVRDELSGLLRELDNEEHAGDRAAYLEMWDGKGELTYDRIGRGTVRVPSNTLSILGGIQPDVVTPYVREAVRGGTGNDGLLQRIQLFVWPDVPREWRNVDKWPDTEAKNEAFALIISTSSRRNKPVRTVRRESPSCVLPKMPRSVSTSGAHAWK